MGDLGFSLQKSDLTSFDQEISLLGRVPLVCHTEHRTSTLAGLGQAEGPLMGTALRHCKGLFPPTPSLSIAVKDT